MTGMPATHAPVAGLQVSVPLQALPSLQTTGVPDTHAPVTGLQVSVPLQALPSSQTTGACAHSKFVVSSHESSVQGLSSLHDAGQLGAATVTDEIWLSRLPTDWPS